MGDYVVVHADPETAPRDLGAQAARLETEGWRVAYQHASVLVAVRGVAPPTVRTWTGGDERPAVLIGEAFDQDPTRDGPMGSFAVQRLADLPAEAAARRLVSKAWGRYVAIWAPRAPDALSAVLREPIGSREALRWRRDNLAIVASRLPADSRLRPARVTIDWPRLGDMLRAKFLASARAPLAGVADAPPGVFCDDEDETRLWSPSDIIRRGGDARPDAKRLAAVIDGCVNALAAGRTVLCELSGGLDSSIVAAALKASQAHLAGGINHAWPQIEGDERAFAEAMAERLAIPLIARQRGPLRLDAERLVAGAIGVRPSYNAGDPDNDRDIAELLETMGVETLFTGRAGDAVLFQMPSASLAGDILRGKAGRIRAPGALADLGRRLNRSVWSLTAEACRDWSAPLPLARPGAFVVDGPAPPSHPWLQDLDGITPAKRLQLQALVNNLSAFGESRRGQVGEIINPLLAQPVIELCLAIPAPILAVGDGDRPFARAAYHDRLPPEILARRGKGALSVHFARGLADNAGFLRDYLGHGALAAHDLIDRDRLDANLQPDELIWRNHTAPLFVAIALEAWARSWIGPLGSPLHR